MLRVRGNSTVSLGRNVQRYLSVKTAKMVTLVAYLAMVCSILKMHLRIVVSKHGVDL